MLPPHTEDFCRPHAGIEHDQKNVTKRLPAVVDRLWSVLAGRRACNLSHGQKLCLHPWFYQFFSAMFFDEPYDWHGGDHPPLVRFLQHAPKSAQGIVSVGWR